MSATPDSALSSGSGRRRRRSSQEKASPPAPAARSRAPLDPSQDTALGPLILTGWVVALSYLPSGLLHAMLGDIVYARDLALAVHLLVSVAWLIKLRQFRWVAQQNWFVLLTPLLLLPALPNHFYTVEVLRTAKWNFAWLDWIILGHFIRLDRKWRAEYALLFWVTVIMLGAEWAAGVYDWVSGDHLIKETWGEKTVFGVSRMFDETIGGRIRVRGLQRDVFSFANIMAVNAVAGMACLTFARKSAHQFAALLWALAFGAMMVVSGGRSAIFGVLAAFIYTVVIFAYPRVTARFGRRYVLVWVGIAITLSLVGVGKFTDFVGNTLLGGSYVGDAESAFMRDNFWTQMLSDFIHEPLILLMGGPAAALLDARVDPMFHWADNQILWNVYHLGIAGAVAFPFLFYKVLRPDPLDGEQNKVRQVVILFLVFVTGEAIARESLTYIGVLPLFVLCGYESANEMLARRTTPGISPLRRVKRRSSSSAGSSSSPGSRSGAGTGSSSNQSPSPGSVAGSNGGGG